MSNELDLTEAIAAFKAAWHQADDEGREGGRVEAGLEAALPAIREQLAQQIEADAPSAELVREGSFASLASRRSGMLRAAFIVRGEV